MNAVAQLYQVPLEQFVAERKRLAKESGDRSLLERKKPSISAWVVNQLYWHARDAFDGMMETAEQLRKGERDADKPHREAIAKLRQRAATMLEDAGHAPTEGVLRRVTTTLSALAAAGGWDPSQPGALAYDLDPPGFSAIGIVPTAPEAPPPKHDGHGKKHDGERSKHEAEEARRAAAEQRRREAEREKLEQQLERARAHADNLAGEAIVAGKHADKLEREAVKAREHAGKLEDRAAEAREHVAKLERELRDL